VIAAVAAVTVVVSQHTFHLVTQGRAFIEQLLALVRRDNAVILEPGLAALTIALLGA
jgi:hypothetical protein